MQKALEIQIKNKIRNSLWRYTATRERAWKEARYRPTADKVNAITAIRRKLSFCAKWGLMGTCRMVAGLECEISTIMPSNLTDPKHLKQKHKMQDMVDFCKKQVSAQLQIAI